MAYPHGAPAVWAPAGWKTAVSHVTGVTIGVLFIVTGVWKITDPFGAAARLEQALVPASLSLIGACLLGVGETFSGALILVPRFRRWGAWLTGALLVFFLVYISANYSLLRGEDCNCFPWVRRAVGPAFFIGDAVMLVFAAVAAWWARPSRGLRGAALALGAIAVFAAVSYGVNARIQASIITPRTIRVDGKPFPMRQGRVFLFIYNPESTHCDAAARTMAKLNWKSEVRIVTVAVEQPQFAQLFLRNAGLRASISEDVEILRKAYHIVSPPYALALENGRVKSAFSVRMGEPRSPFDQPDFESALRRIGFTN
ncbi:MAG: MauE/DoxX family redox-associated membrane protein [Bryobacteraceae bacterium]